MKIGYLKLLIVCSLLFILFTINTIFNIFSLNMLVLFLFIIFVVLKFLVGFEKDRVRFRSDIILMLLIYICMYYIITYLSGLFLGFNLNGYSLKFWTIIKNILPMLFLIVGSELVRYTLTIKGSRNKSILVLVVLIFTMFDVTLGARGFDLSLPSELVKFVVTLLLPSVSKNVMLTYLTYKVGYKPATLYRLLMEIPMYFLPIFPALGIYIDSILKVLFPAYIIFETNRNFSKLDNSYVPVRNQSRLKIISIVITFVVSIVIIGLTCGLFKFYVLTIGSGSMEPAIYKGDILVVQKLSSKEMKKLSIDDVLVFRYEKKVVVHRIIEVVERNNKLTFYTKGDNNVSPDGWAIEETNVIGTSNVRIPFIGYPTVWLNELINKRG